MNTGVFPQRMTSRSFAALLLHALVFALVYWFAFSLRFEFQLTPDDWVMLGIKTAQVALSYGADDLDGTVVHEKIYHDAGSDSPQEMTVKEIRRLIEEAGRVPVERDTLYNEVIREGETRWKTGRSLKLVQV